MTWILVTVVRYEGTPQAERLELRYGPFDSELVHLGVAQSRAQAAATLGKDGFEVVAVRTL